MKFIALLALFGGVSAVRLESHSAIQAHSQTVVPALAHSWSALQTKSNQASLKKSASKFVQTTLKSLLPGPGDLTPEQQLEIVEWVISELSGGTITKDEAHDALSAFLDKHGYPQPTPEEWEMLEAVFDYIDKSGDGHIDLHEFVMAMAQHGDEMIQLRKTSKQFVQTTLRSKLPCKLTPEQEKEVFEWVVSELGGGTITKDEAHDALSGFLDKHGFPQPTPEEWQMLEALFDHVDKNGDGELDLHEVASAVMNHK